METIRIATRNSPLALWQAKYVRQLLLDAHDDLEVEIVGMTTEGDRLLGQRLSTVGGKGLFLKELEVSLLNNETDIAVHSMKDVPVNLPDGLDIDVVLERADPRDAFVSNDYQNLYALPNGARVGTSSLRRTSQLMRAFPELEFLPLRGNVNTRLAKLDAGEYDAIILASAGLERLEFEHRIKQYITPELCLPAVGQGIIGIECRSDDAHIKARLQVLHSRESELVLAAERAMNATLDGGCQVPVAGFAEITKGRIRMRGMVAAVDGSKVLYSNAVATELSVEKAQELGHQVGEELLKQGADALLTEAAAQLPAVKSDHPPVVLLTRQRRHRGNMEELLVQLGCEVEHIETLQIDPLLSEEAMASINNINTFTDVLFVSRNAVEFGMALLEDAGLSIPESVNVLSVGSETAKQLKVYGLNALFPSRGAGADALLGVSIMKDLKGRRILVMRGSHGLDWPSEEMRSRGAQVEHADVYQQRIPANGASMFSKLFKCHSRIDAVFLHSAESARNFMEFVKADLRRFVGARLIVGSERIGEVARDAGWLEQIVLAESPSNKHMMMAFSGNQSRAPQ